MQHKAWQAIQVLAGIPPAFWTCKFRLARALLTSIEPGQTVTAAAATTWLKLQVNEVDSIATAVTAILPRLTPTFPGVTVMKSTYVVSSFTMPLLTLAMAISASSLVVAQNAGDTTTGQRESQTTTPNTPSQAGERQQGAQGQQGSQGNTGNQQSRSNQNSAHSADCEDSGSIAGNPARQGTGGGQTGGAGGAATGGANSQRDANPNAQIAQRDDCMRLDRDSNGTNAPGSNNSRGDADLLNRGNRE